MHLVKMLLRIVMRQLRGFIENNEYYKGTAYNMILFFILIEEWIDILSSFMRIMY